MRFQEKNTCSSIHARFEAISNHIQIKKIYADITWWGGEIWILLNMCFASLKMIFAMKEMILKYHIKLPKLKTIYPPLNGYIDIHNFICSWLKLTNVLSDKPLCTLV